MLRVVMFILIAVLTGIVIGWTADSTDVLDLRPIHNTGGDYGVWIPDTLAVRITEALRFSVHELRGDYRRWCYEQARINSAKDVIEIEGHRIWDRETGIIRVEQTLKIWRDNYGLD